MHSGDATPKLLRGLRARRPQMVPQLGGHEILIEQLEEMALTWPAPEGWDPEAERARLAAGTPT